MPKYAGATAFARNGASGWSIEIIYFILQLLGIASLRLIYKSGRMPLPVFALAKTAAPKHAKAGLSLAIAKAAAP